MCSHGTDDGMGDAAAIKSCGSVAGEYFKGCSQFWVM
jgi:hypothetical protein